MADQTYRPIPLAFAFVVSTPISLPFLDFFVYLIIQIFMPFCRKVFLLS